MKKISFNIKQNHVTLSNFVEKHNKYLIRVPQISADKTKS